MKPIILISIIILFSGEIFSQGQIYFTNYFQNKEGKMEANELSVHFKNCKELNNILESTVDTFRQITIESNQMKTWPTKLFSKKNVKYIQINSESLTKIDKKLNQMENLEVLEMNLRQFKCLPDDLYKARSLSIITISAKKHALKSEKSAKKIIENTLTNSDYISILIGSFYIERHIQH